MNRTIAIAAACALLAATAGCQQKAAETEAAAETAKLSDADAAAAADATQVAWVSMDVPKIESVYAKDVVAFDPMAAPLSTTWDSFHKLQEGFAAMKFDKVDVPDRKIQVLDANTFIVSGTGTLTGKGEMKEGKMRFTNVYHKQADGSWKIVNEHVSFVPTGEAPA